MLPYPFKEGVSLSVQVGLVVRIYEKASLQNLYKLRCTDKFKYG